MQSYVHCLTNEDLLIHDRKIRESETHDDFWSANGPEVLSNEYDGIVQNQQGKSLHECERRRWQHRIGMSVENQFYIPVYIRKFGSHI
jgi:hypothetical protein